jgi:thiosulfate/3-mercaptopyruvate sulfurtransferase
MISPVVDFQFASTEFFRNPDHVVFAEVVSCYYPSHVTEYNQCLNFPYLKVNIDQFEVLNDWRLKSRSELFRIVESLGLTAVSHKTIFIFDCLNVKGCSNSAQFDASARLYSTLLSLGFTNISIIHDVSVSSVAGSLGLKSNNLTSQKTPKLSSHLIVQNNYSPILNYQQLKAFISGQRGDYHLVDARTEAEFLGLDTGYAYIDIAGKIPKSINIDSNNYRALDHENASQLLRRLAQALEVNGIGKVDCIIWYCGTSWRAARMFVLTRALGYRNTYLYDGGWFEWQRKLSTSKRIAIRAVDTD